MPSSITFLRNRRREAGILVLAYAAVALLLHTVSWYGYGGLEDGHPSWFDLKEFFASSGVWVLSNFVVALPVWYIVIVKLRDAPLWQRLVAHAVFLPLFVWGSYNLTMLVKDYFGWVNYFGGRSVVWIWCFDVLFYVIQFGLIHAYVLHRNNVRQAAAAVPAPLPPSYPERLALQQGSRRLLIATDDILSVAAFGDYSKVHTTEGTLLASSGITALANKLDPGKFLRVHRSFLVNLDRARVLNRRGRYWEIELTDGSQVRVSESYLPEVRRLLA